MRAVKEDLVVLFDTLMFTKQLEVAENVLSFSFLLLL